jgi:glutaredoxin 3
MRMRAILIVCALFLIAQNASPLLLYVTGGLRYDVARHGEVVLLSTAGCAYCSRMRTYLHAGGVPYRELDIEHDPEGSRLFHEAGGIGVPLLLVGEIAVQGYDPAAVREAVGRAAATGRGGGAAPDRDALKSIREDVASKTAQ